MAVRRTEPWICGFATTLTRPVTTSPRASGSTEAPQAAQRRKCSSQCSRSAIRTIRICGFRQSRFRAAQPIASPASIVSPTRRHCRCGCNCKCPRVGEKRRCIRRCALRAFFAPGHEDHHPRRRRPAELHEDRAADGGAGRHRRAFVRCWSTPGSTTTSDVDGVPARAGPARRPTGTSESDRRRTRCKPPR